MHVLPEFKEYIPLVLVLPFLIAMALEDLRKLRISNRLVLVMIAAFALSGPILLPLTEIGLRLAAAAMVFALGLTGFILRLWGGGDVKAFSALILFLPSSALILYAYVFSASMLIGISLVLLLRATMGSENSEWSSLKPNSSYPMGVSIAMSGMLLIPILYLY